MSNQIATLAELADYQGSNLTRVSAPDQRGWQVALDGAADYIGKISGRMFYPEPALVAGADTAAPTTRTFSARGRTRMRITDLRSATVVQLDGSTLTSDIGYDIGPLGIDGEPATYITLSMLSPFITVRPLWTSTLSITGRWGFLPTPPCVKEAVLYMAARKIKRRDNAYADQIATPDGGMFAYFNSLPDEIKGAVMAYRVMHAAIVGAGLS